MSASDSIELSIDETIEILRPALPDDSLVLVGGQAINFWLAAYRGREPALGSLAGVTSSDIDFLGSRESVERIAAAINGSVRLEGPRMPTLAVVRFKDRNGNERIIDFLRAVHGLDETRIRQTAVAVEPRDAHGQPTGIELKIMHPVVCLESRVHNVHDLEKYRTPRGLAQLAAAVGCARAYIVECCDRGASKDAYKAIEVIGELACSNAGRGVRVAHGVDPLEAIPSDLRLGDAFFRENLPRLRRRAGHEA